MVPARVSIYHWLVPYLGAHGETEDRCGEPMVDQNCLPCDREERGPGILFKGTSSGCPKQLVSSKPESFLWKNSEIVISRLAKAAVATAPLSGTGGREISLS